MVKVQEQSNDLYMYTTYLILNTHENYVQKSIYNEFNWTRFQFILRDSPQLNLLSNNSTAIDGN